MKKMIYAVFLSLSVYSSYTYAFICNMNDTGAEIPKNGVEIIDLIINNDIVEHPPNVINEYADMGDYINCTNELPGIYTDLLFVTSYTVLQRSPNVQFGLQVQGVNYFEPLASKVEVLNLPRYFYGSKPLDLALVMKVTDTPNDGVIIRKGDELIRMEMYRYGIYHPGQDDEIPIDNPWNYTWIIRAANDIVINSSTCSINNGDVLTIDLGGMYTTKIPTSSGTMQMSKELPISFECAQSNVTMDVNIVYAGETTTFSPNAIIAREGVTHGTGNIIPQLGIELYHKASSKLMMPNNVATGGFTTKLVNGVGNDTIIIAPIKSSAQDIIYTGPFTSVATLIMSLP
jgi:minor fimbrial subunit